MYFLFPRAFSMWKIFPIPRELSLEQRCAFVHIHDLVLEDSSSLLTLQTGKRSSKICFIGQDPVFVMSWRSFLVALLFYSLEWGDHVELWRMAEWMTAKILFSTLWPNSMNSTSISWRRVQSLFFSSMAWIRSVLDRANRFCLVNYWRNFDGWKLGWPCGCRYERRSPTTIAQIAINLHWKSRLSRAVSCPDQPHNGEGWMFNRILLARYNQTTNRARFLPHVLLWR